MSRPAILALALLLVGSAARAAPGVITPDPDTTPMRPMGAADRTANGPSPLATPPADAGDAPDPDDAPVPVDNMTAPAPR